MGEEPQIEFLQKELSDLRLAMDSSVNPNTGTSSISVAIPLTQGRQGFGPQLALNYSSGGGNTPYGVGWNLSGLSSISIYTKKGFPKYDHTDNYSLDGGQLVPYLKEGIPWIETKDSYTIHYFRNRFERTFDRIERWENSNGNLHWVVRSPDTSIAIYGKSQKARIFDPEKPEHIYSWLLEEQYDSNGNLILYKYQEEDDKGIDTTAIYEFNRFKNRKLTAQRYLKSIHYANDKAVTFGDAIPNDIKWNFEVILDYGEHPLQPEDAYEKSIPWPIRQDPHSSFGTGFEIRTWRLCRRILMFHHFPSSDFGERVLVGATELHHKEKPQGTVLDKIKYTGYRKDNDTYWSESIPPLSFHYQEPEIGGNFIKPASDIDFENLPYGFGDVNYRMLDLYGEGVPGILFEAEKAWYYKPNLGNGKFGRLQTVLEKPSHQIGSYAISDFDNNGNPNLVALQGSKAGYYEYDRDQEQWSGFQVFQNAPSVEHGTQLMDINGDGMAELVVMKQDRLTYYPSKGKSGFAAGIELSREQDNGVSHIPTLGTNLQLDYFSADMTGDGIPDQVRVLNGRVEYWSHLGNGRFTEGTAMANTPILEEGFEFDASRIRLVDLTGSGTSDLVYLGRGELRYWINASGNQFLEGDTIFGLPYIDNFASVQIADFLGNGTACLVWSSALPGQGQNPIQYLPLTGIRPPGLLNSVDNGMGMETHWTYGYSARQYLRDKISGEEWITKLPSHSYIVEKQEVIDKIGRTTLTTEYRYHDGFYDGEEREFRGFAFVEQYDAETLQEYAIGEALPTSEITCVRTWFHTGDFRFFEKKRKQYYSEGQSEFELAEHHIEGFEQLDSDSFGDAFRALAGQVLRTEVYNASKLDVPYQVSQNTYQIRALQPKIEDGEACFTSFEREQLVCNYEQKASNPLVNHTLVLETDAYGTPTLQCTVGYPNKEAPDTVHGRPNPQKKLHITAVQTSVVHFNEPDRYELAIPLESKAYEISELTVPIGSSLFVLDTNLRENVADGIQQEDSLRTWERFYYWNENQSNVLGYGTIGNKTLLHHQEVWVGETTLFESVFNGKEDARTLLAQGKYREDGNNHWWQPSEVMEYARRDEFSLPKKVISSRTGRTSNELGFDTYNLTINSITDRSGFVTRAKIDYHLLAPDTIVDINDNVGEVIYDPLGMVRVSSNHGTIKLDENTGEKAYGNEPLEQYDKRLLQEQIVSNIIDDPKKYLGNASAFTYYNLFSREENDYRPVQMLGVLREDFLYNGKDGPPTDSQIQTTISYLDGFGRNLQNCQRVEDGLALKVENGLPQFQLDGEPIYEHTNNCWLFSGHVVYNKKQEPIRQYEPFFYPDSEFVALDVLQQFGVTAELHYDAMGRNVKTTNPNHTVSETKISAWHIGQYDAIDTLDENTLNFSLHKEGLNADEKKTLDDAKAYADTPTLFHLDALGREVIVEERGLNNQHRVSVTEFDFYGNPIRILDPRGLEAFRYQYDRTGKLLHEYSMDAGEKWTFANSEDLPVHFWDGRGLHQTTIYDDHNRPLRLIADGLEGYDQKTMQHWVYGDDHALQNANGLPVVYYDEAGRQNFVTYDPNGKPLISSRQVTKDFKTEPDWTILDQSLLTDEEFKTNFELDSLGRPVQEDLADGTSRKYKYHLSGGLQSLQVSSADGVWQDRVILKDTGYNAKGQKTVIDYGNGIRTKYQYDKRSSRLRQLQSWALRNTTAHYFQNLKYSYDPVGSISKIENTANHLERSPIPFEKEYRYDVHYQLIEARGVIHKALFSDAAEKNAANFASYMNGGQANSLNDLGQIEKYKRIYEYDLSGNRISMRHDRPTKTLRADKLIATNSNRSLPKLGRNGLEFTNVGTHFDQNGNCQYMPRLAALTWNYRNNTALATKVARADGNIDAEYYQYGGDGLRVRKVNEVYGNIYDSTGTKTTTETIYCYGCEVIRKTEGTTLTQEHWLSHFKDGDTALARGYHWTVDRNGTLLGTRKLHYNLTDHLGSSTVETSEDSELISFEEYFPFGLTAFILGDHAIEIKRNDYRYSGKERDDFTGLYNYGYRYYAPWLGNWINPDPIGPEDGLNLYRFVWNSPMNFVDGDGLQANIYKEGNVTIRPQNDQMLSETSIAIGKDHLKSGGITVVGYDKEGKYIGARDATLNSYTEKITILAENSAVSFHIFLYDPSYIPLWEVNSKDNDTKTDIEELEKKERKYKPKETKEQRTEKALAIIDEDVGGVDLEELMDEKTRNIPEVSTQENQKKAEAEAPYKPYGNNDYANSAAAVGDALLEALFDTSSENVADTITKLMYGTNDDRVEIASSYAKSKAMNVFSGTPIGSAWSMHQTMNSYSEQLVEKFKDDGFGGVGEKILKDLDSKNPFAVVRDEMTTFNDSMGRGDIYQSTKSFSKSILEMAKFASFFAGAGAIKNVNKTKGAKSVGTYRGQKGHHVHQSASYGKKGPSRKTNSNHNEAITVDLKGHSQNLSTEHGKATAVQREMNQAMHGKDIDPTQSNRSGVVSTKGFGNLSPSPSPSFENIKAYYALRAAGISEIKAYDIVMTSIKQIEKRGITVVRVPTR